MQLQSVEEYWNTCYMLIEGGWGGVWHLLTAVCFSCFYNSYFVGVGDFKLYDCIQFWTVCFSWSISCDMQLWMFQNKMFYLFLSAYKVTKSKSLYSCNTVIVACHWICSSFVLKTIFGELRQVNCSVHSLLLFVTTTKSDKWICTNVEWLSVENAPGFIIKPIFCTITWMSFLTGGNSFLPSKFDCRWKTWSYTKTQVVFVSEAPVFDYLHYLLYSFTFQREMLYFIGQMLHHLQNHLWW